MQTAAITVDDLAVARRAVIAAEARQVELMLAFDAQQAEASKHEVNPTAGLLARSMIRVWLRRFVVRVEADAATARAEAERADRHVSIVHGDDGMSWINAYLPSPAAAAIERRLYREGRKQPKDGRTLVQKEADLFASWLTTNENTGQAAAHADIAVIVDADVLAGARHGFAESPDGAWVAPTTWITNLAHDPVWYRMIRDPITRDILSIDYRGRYAPEILKKALYFLHGTCAVPGCLIPAWKCEIDHQIPWPADTPPPPTPDPCPKPTTDKKATDSHPRPGDPPWPDRHCVQAPRTEQPGRRPGLLRLSHMPRLMTWRRIGDSNP